MNPAKYCEDKARGSGSSFFYAFLFLPEDQRRAMMALYAFCREVDDIADEVSDRAVATRKLAFWGEEISRTFAGEPRHPVGKELNWARQRFPLSEELFIEILDGMLMDVNHKPFLKASDLALYCHRVAGVVGLLTIEIFGHTSRQAGDFATTLGEALQLTNILRDLREDAARGRIYIPQEDRIRFSVADQDFNDGTMSDGMRHLIAHYVDKVGKLYVKAIEQLPDEDRESLRPSLLMGAIYFAHFTRLQKAGERLWDEPPRLLPIQKIWIAWRMWRYEKRAARKSLPVTFAI
ncbi:MAG: squalene synthase HpnD [Zetaproteobacteria bacterium CG12_big_fil_rev_8_21_14_0_65_55_1124]|nr:MAG: squalene synthase HpnD [Zetaproteobacteria bacterium CG1_02_55_237]PIS20386.1 MAG: squalene synthase HpnD [Zetaproteobacteria bacterium CG08_land_8_20_14_0_20_55_17]PIW42581.1 MAG: squalene synthase HpnD [Zetaproteobacteria bacterium CG12_big_fil_rev_8_21_14_0_65_55_1124]PIY54187.1 MAG: squalene synthase HpnD [Zetaproteobacteria bacterium CG_4_10_14_0_8_um_filter_55_43]PIZ38383.1 MAG: squalene synthase HpnD [Zetaproteobacteria bacterium CG_4_10_14_0_2_um_filter_55_20]PJB81169.1 MAG: sq